MTKKKVWMVLLTAIVGIGAGSGITYSQKVKAEEMARIEVKQKQMEIVDWIQKDVKELYKDNPKELLAEDITQEKIDAIQKSLKELEGEKFDIDNAGRLNTAIMDLGYATNMFELQHLVKGLLNEQGAVVENETLDEVDKKIEQLKDIKPKFVEVQQQIVDDVKHQLKQIQEATVKVNQLFTDAEQKEVKSDVTRDGYNLAKEEIEKIKQQKAKTDLSYVLEKVDQHLIAKAEAERKSKEAQQAQQTQAIKEIQSSKNVSSSSSNNSGSKNKSAKNTSTSNAGSSSKNSSKSATNNKNNTSPTKGSSTPPEDKPGTTWDLELKDKGEGDGYSWEYYGD